MTSTDARLDAIRGAPAFSIAARRSAAWLLPVFHLVDREAGQHRRLDELIAGRFHERVALLDEQPIALALLDLHERPFAVELVAAELEQEFALLESLSPILERDPLAAIPHDDSAGAVVPGRDLPLEVAVFDRMVFDVHGEPLVVHVVRRTLRNGPGPQHAAHLEAKIEVEIARGVLVDDEQPSGRGRDRAHWFGRRVGRAFGAVLGKAVVHVNTEVQNPRDLRIWKVCRKVRCA